MSSKLVDEDDYWNTSENKGFDFDVEKSSFGLSSPRSKGDHLFTDDNISEISYELPKNEIPLSLIISESDLRMILEEQSMSEFPIPKNSTPEEEVRILRRQLLEKSHAPLPSTTISKILLGKPCSLENFKSIKEKEELLDEAILSGNGDAILIIVLFLVKTLKKNHINRILQKRPVAVNHYINYLALRLEINEAIDILTMLGKSNEAALLQYQIIVQTTSNIDTRKKKLKQLYSNFYTQPGSNSFYSQMIGNYINLLEWQYSLSSNNTLDVIDSSVLKSLYYVCNNYKWGDGSNTSSPTKSNNKSIALNPIQFSDLYQVNVSQFEWIALNERGKSQAWLDIETLFEKKSWKNLKTKSFQIHLPLERVILQLYALSAPQAVLNKFLSHLDDVNRRLILSKRVGAIRSEIDSLVLLKDKNELEVLRSGLDAGTEEYFYAENALKNLNSKWKADGIKIMKG